MSGKIIFSRVLAIGDRRAMGLYEVPFWGFLLGFGMGIFLQNFQIGGI